MTPREIAEYVIWYGRKKKGKVSEVATDLLEEFPYLTMGLTHILKGENLALCGAEIEDICIECRAIEQELLHGETI